MRTTVAMTGVWCLCAASVICAEYGDKVDSLPNWAERAVVVMTNLVRMAPTEYRDEYIGSSGSILTSMYPAVAPVYWHPDLALASRDHAIDMTDCGMQHSSCDGTSWATRVSDYYTVSGTLSENVATGQTTPQQVVRTWIYDRGAADGSGGDGHRKNIMGGQYRDVGTGFAAGNDTYWAQDFGGGTSSGFPPHAIAAGAHLFPESGSTTFMMNFYDDQGRAPGSVRVIVDGTPHELSLYMGTESRGTYTVSLSRASECRRYHFEATDGGGEEWRYPGSGTLVTYGEGTCRSDYEPAGAVDHESAVPAMLQGRMSVRRTGNTLVVERTGHGMQAGSVYLYASDGRLIAERHIKAGVSRVTVPVRAAGVYHIAVTDGQGAIVTPVRHIR